MPVRYYLDKRINCNGEAPIRLVWSFNGDRYQTTIGFSIPQKDWDSQKCLVKCNNTKSSAINAFIIAMNKTVFRLEDYARTHNFTLTKQFVQKVVADAKLIVQEDVAGVIRSGVQFLIKENEWMNMLRDGLY